MNGSGERQGRSAHDVRDCVSMYSQFIDEFSTYTARLILHRSVSVCMSCIHVLMTALNGVIAFCSGTA